MLYATQHRTVLTIYSLIPQTIIIAQILPTAGKGAFNTVMKTLNLTKPDMQQQILNTKARSGTVRRLARKPIRPILRPTQYASHWQCKPAYLVPVPRQDCQDPRSQDPSSLALVNSRIVYLSGAGLQRLSWKKAIKRM